jgi:site-specific DNA recombinase
MIAAYQRISRADGDLGKDGKDKSNSIENQKELIQRYISCKESLQNVPVMDFVDDGYTGSNFDRPGFQQMMDGVRNGKIDTIIVKDLSGRFVAHIITHSLMLQHGQLSLFKL